MSSIMQDIDTLERKRSHIVRLLCDMESSKLYSDTDAATLRLRKEYSVLGKLVANLYVDLAKIYR